MLVLNRRLGESIVIEHGIELSVLSISDRKVWFCVEGPGVDPPVRLSAVALSDEEARLEVGAPESVRIDAGGIHVRVAGPDHPSAEAKASVGFDRSVGEGVGVGDGLRVTLTSMAKRNPCIAIEGPGIGTGVQITLIRPVGAYVRIGVDAPGRRVYRKELWDQPVRPAYDGAAPVPTEA